MKKIPDSITDPTLRLRLGSIARDLTNQIKRQSVLKGVGGAGRGGQHNKDLAHIAKRLVELENQWTALCPTSAE